MQSLSSPISSGPEKKKRTPLVRKWVSFLIPAASGEFHFFLGRKEMSQSMRRWGQFPMQRFTGFPFDRATDEGRCSSFCYPLVDMTGSRNSVCLSPRILTNGHNIRSLWLNSNWTPQIEQKFACCYADAIPGVDDERQIGKRCRWKNRNKKKNALPVDYCLLSTRHRPLMEKPSGNK